MKSIHLQKLYRKNWIRDFQPWCCKFVLLWRDFYPSNDCGADQHNRPTGFLMVKYNKLLLRHTSGSETQRVLMTKPERHFVAVSRAPLTSRRAHTPRTLLKNELNQKLFMHSLHILCGTLHFAMQMGAAGNEAYAVWKGQLPWCVVAGTGVCLGSLQARDRTQ